MTLIYYAESIDNRHGHIAALGDELIAQLAKLDLTTYRPLRAWHAGNNDPTTVEAINRYALANSALLIADLSCGRPTIGVPAEIEHATRTLGIPALVIHYNKSVVLEANPLVTIAPYNWSLTQIAETAAQLANTHHNHRNELRYNLTDHTTPPLQRTYEDDAGIDLVTTQTTRIPLGEFRDIPTTVTAVQPPPDTWLMITGRSSTLRKRGLLVPTSVIDPGWRGPLLVGAYNLSGCTDNQPYVEVAAGERIGQLIAIHNRTAELTLQHTTNPLDPHPRGTNGFGSSG